MKKRFIILWIIFLLYIFIFSQNFDNIHIYLWDNSDGLTFPNPDDTTQAIGYAYNIIQALENCGFDTLSGNLFIGDTLPFGAAKDEAKTMLQDYGALFIVCGHRSATEELISSEDITSLESYLGYGGCVYLEGNNIAEFLQNNYPYILNDYFNTIVTQIGDDTIYSHFDTLITDTSSHFGNSYSFVYMPEQVVDLGNDIISAYDDTIPEPYYYSILVFDSSSNKLYKTTASAYAPPAEKYNKVSMYKTFLQTTVTGAFACPYIEGSVLSQAENNELIRTSYIRDVLDFFSLGNTLIINHTSNTQDTIFNIIMKNLGISFDYLYIAPGNPLPDYNTYIKYESILLYTGTTSSDYVFQYGDIENLELYMDFGGKIFLLGENIAQSVGNPGYDGIYENYFLSHYFGIDFIANEPQINDGNHTASDEGIFYGKIDNISVSSYISPDQLYPVNIYGGNTNRAYLFTNTVKLNDSIVSGITFEDSTHKAVFLSYALESSNDTQKVQDIISTILVDFFTYDTSYTPLETTALNEFFITYKQYIDNIIFNIYIANPKNGYLELFINNNPVSTYITNTNQYNYELNSPTNFGTFTINYKSLSGKIINSYCIKILPLNIQSNIKFYIKNNMLYIESDLSNIEFNIYNIYGAKIFNKKLHTGINIIKEYKYLSNGVYFFNINNKKLKIFKI